MDIGSAFTFVFDDEEWVKKLGIGGGILLLAVPFTIVLIGVALIIIIMGYMIETLKNVRDGQAKPLPEWENFGDLFFTGLKAFGIAFIYSIPAILLSCATSGLGFAAPQLDSDTASSSLALVTTCLSCLQLVLNFLAYALLPAGLIRYAQYDTVGSALQFGEMFSFIKDNIGDYIIVLLLALVANIIAFFGIIICLIGFFFTTFWSYLVMAHLFGQLARKANVSMVEL